MYHSRLVPPSLYTDHRIAPRPTALPPLPKLAGLRLEYHSKRDVGSTEVRDVERFARDMLQSQAKTRHFLREYMAVFGNRSDLLWEIQVLLQQYSRNHCRLIGSRPSYDVLNAEAKARIEVQEVKRPVRNSKVRQWRIKDLQGDIDRSIVVMERF